LIEKRKREKIWCGKKSGVWNSDTFCVREEAKWYMINGGRRKNIIGGKVALVALYMAIFRVTFY